MLKNFGKKIKLSFNPFCIPQKFLRIHKELFPKSSLCGAWGRAPLDLPYISSITTPSARIRSKKSGMLLATASAPRITPPYLVAITARLITTR